jgi:hypothetical protein
VGEDGLEVGERRRDRLLSSEEGQRGAIHECVRERALARRQARQSCDLVVVRRRCHALARLLVPERLRGGGEGRPHLRLRTPLDQSPDDLGDALPRLAAPDRHGRPVRDGEQSFVRKVHAARLDRQECPAYWIIVHHERRLASSPRGLVH